MKKFIRYTLWTVGGLLLAVAVIVGSGWLWSYRLDGTLLLPSECTLTPPTGAMLGQPVVAEVEVELPLHAALVRAAAVAGDGTTLVGEPVIRFDRWRWSRKIYLVSTEVRPFRPGTAGPGSLALEFDGVTAGDKPEANVVVIPGFSVKPLENVGTELLLADAVEPIKTHTWGWLWLLLIIPAALLVSYLLRRGNSAAQMPPWERALLALDELRRNVETKRIPLESGFARLTDLVRDYLEERFSLPASRRTTNEFLTALDHDDTPLPQDQRPFLRDFLTVADQVKFAKAPPDQILLNQAIDRAGKLISGTGENTEVGKGGAK